MGEAKHIAIVGAGPGGLTAAMILARRGFRVTVYERAGRVGGRNAPIALGPFTFDTGPTFLMMKFILDEVFEEAGANSADQLAFTRLDPMYRLQFPDVVLDMTGNHGEMQKRIDAAFPGNEGALSRYLAAESVRFKRTYPCLQMDYSSPLRMLNTHLLHALPKLSLGRTLYGVLGDYFKDEKLKLSFTFQAKYLGMSPWDCPGAFAILAYVEHAFGVWHTRGGLSAISDAMAKVAEANGAAIRCSTPVRRLALKGRTVVGVELEDGTVEEADEVVVNADFGHAMTHLVPPGVLRRWSPEKLEKKPFSCSTFMLYLGLDRMYDLPHHAIYFARDYRKNVRDIFHAPDLPEDFSFYVRNASVTDPTLAPAGKSAVYVLVPVANRRARIDWAREAKPFRDRVVAEMERRGGMAGLTGAIEAEKVITPLDWENDHCLYKGATFNLAHTLTQMLAFRPGNRFQELDRCYLVGGGTHPGSGLPTIYESGRIAANLIARKYRVPFESRNPLA